LVVSGGKGDRTRDVARFLSSGFPTLSDASDGIVESIDALVNSGGGEGASCNN
jgi:hypothetical protein